VWCGYAGTAPPYYTGRSDMTELRRDLSGFRLGILIAKTDIRALAKPRPLFRG
jgi:hypothetical protein